MINNPNCFPQKDPFIFGRTINAQSVVQSVRRDEREGDKLPIAEVSNREPLLDVSNYVVEMPSDDDQLVTMVSAATPDKENTVAPMELSSALGDLKLKRKGVHEASESTAKKLKK